MRIGRTLFAFAATTSAVAGIGGAYGYSQAEKMPECAGLEAVGDKIFCGLGQGSSEQAIEKLQHYIEQIGEFIFSFTDNPEDVPEAVESNQFGVDSHPNQALRVPAGMPERASSLTNDQIMQLARISFEDIKRYWTDYRKINLGHIWLEPMVVLGDSYKNCGGLEGHKFAGLYCDATKSIALSEHIRYGVPADASTQQLHIYIRSVLGHEFGHAVQSFQKAQEAGRMALGLTMEEQATCLGGNALAGDPVEVENYVASYMAEEAFWLGVNASRCGI